MEVKPLKKYVINLEIKKSYKILINIEVIIFVIYHLIFVFVILMID
jgi:hypothetical protein